MQPIRVIVAGATGRMGREAVEAVREAADLQLCAVVSRAFADAGQPAVGERAAHGAAVFADVRAALNTVPADVLVEFTSAESAPGNLRAALEAGVRPVSGTTGLGAAVLDDLGRLATERSLGAVVIPNFSLGATVLSILARTAAPYFGAAELVELHHDRKRDAPSGTALALARAIGPRLRGAAERQAGSPLEAAAGRDAEGRRLPTTTPALATGAPRAAPAAELRPGGSPARGLDVEGVPVHSVRLAGLVAHHELIFAADGETLTLRHDSISRASFMPGVLLAVRTVSRVRGLVTSLEDILALATPSGSTQTGVQR